MGKSKKSSNQVKGLTLQQDQGSTMSTSTLITASMDISASQELGSTAATTPSSCQALSGSSSPSLIQQKHQKASNLNIEDNKKPLENSKQQLQTTNGNSIKQSAADSSEPMAINEEKSLLINGDQIESQDKENSNLDSEMNEIDSSCNVNANVNGHEDKQNDNLNESDNDVDDDKMQTCELVTENEQSNVVSLGDEQNGQDDGHQDDNDDENDDDEEDIDCDGAAGRKMFVGGLSWQTGPDGLRDHFGQFGQVTEVMIMNDPATRRSR